MKRKCNLELRLERPSVFLRPADHDCHHPDMQVVDKDEGGKQQLTIFYNGKITVCDATELQARTIISLASDNAEIYESGSARSDVASAAAAAVYSPTTGLKRSLMRFLHTRKTRVKATSPYRRPS